jgi:hypothetical protein
VTSAAQQHLCDFFGLRVEPSSEVVEEPNDPFYTQALWSEWGSRGVGTCSNHSERSHGRANRKVAAVHSLVRRISILVGMLQQKAQNFGLKSVNRSAQAFLRDLQAGTATTDAECPVHCGWEAIYSNRFAIPNFPCRHTAWSRAPQIDWARGGEPFTLGAFDSSPHDVVSVQYAGDRAWHLARDRTHVQRCETAADPSEARPGLDENKEPEIFFQRLIRELRVIFPGGYQGSTADLATDYGAFLQDRSRDGPVMRARFQLVTFNNLRKRR